MKGGVYHPLTSTDATHCARVDCVIPTMSHSVRNLIISSEISQLHFLCSTLLHGLMSFLCLCSQENLLAKLKFSSLVYCSMLMCFCYMMLWRGKAGRKALKLRCRVRGLRFASALNETQWRINYDGNFFDSVWADVWSLICESELVFLGFILRPV